MLGFLVVEVEANGPVEYLDKYLRHVASKVAIPLSNLKVKEKLMADVFRDPLTRLYNRRYFEEVFAKEISRASRHHLNMAVIMLDVDHFKQLNDTFGHLAGDEALVHISQFLMNNTRTEDTVCRYGGEEVVVLMPEISAEDAITRANVLRLGIRGMQVTAEGKELPPISVSIGVACFPGDGNNPKSLLQHADQALYRAKCAGRDRVVA